jgi:hypothetical protein
MKRKRNRQEKHGTAYQLGTRLWHPEVPGPLWDGTRRVADGQIQAYCHVLAREFRPQRIILFGSYATGGLRPTRTLT